MHESGAHWTASRNDMLDPRVNIGYKYITGLIQSPSTDRIHAARLDQATMIHWVVAFSRHGKLRLKKWFKTESQHDKQKLINEAITMILARKSGMCNVLEHRETKLVYRRYASLYFCCCIDFEDNELIVLEFIHRFVQILDDYFGNVCELDLVFGFQMAYIILDELVIDGEMQESSVKSVIGHIKKMSKEEMADEFQ
ncbi:hypothetical protein SeMB42_g04150 [Synchytrium endobioticum]|uniref:AP-1 complex subunit sigma-1 n=1 Tax=Synchytrium endobioticum TaxID=286115 RepID=A0A507D0Y6_9FUNG|nr:hypothetical protein SeMB42_g04150 [Synchytrium endobioticum]